MIRNPVLTIGVPEVPRSSATEKKHMLFVTLPSKTPCEIDTLCKSFERSDYFLMIILKKTPSKVTTFYAKVAFCLRRIQFYDPQSLSGASLSLQEPPRAAWCFQEPPGASQSRPEPLLESPEASQSSLSNTIRLMQHICTPRLAQHD